VPCCLNKRKGETKRRIEKWTWHDKKDAEGPRLTRFYRKGKTTRVDCWTSWSCGPMNAVPIQTPKRNMMQTITRQEINGSRVPRWLRKIPRKFNGKDTHLGPSVYHRDRRHQWGAECMKVERGERKSSNL
jgi:hypothetical protein